MAEQRRWLSVSAAGAYFNLKPRTIYSLIARHELPAEGILRFGKQIRICPELVEAGLALPARGGIKKAGRSLRAHNS